MNLGEAKFKKEVLIGVFIFICLSLTPLARAQLEAEIPEKLVFSPTANKTVFFKVRNMGEAKVENLSLHVTSKKVTYRILPYQTSISPKKISQIPVSLKVKDVKPGIYSLNWRLTSNLYNKSGETLIRVSRVSGYLDKFLSYYFSQIESLRSDLKEVEGNKSKANRFLDQAEDNLRNARGLLKYGLYKQANEEINKAKDKIIEASLLVEKLKRKQEAAEQEKLEEKRIRLKEVRNYILIVIFVILIIFTGVKTFLYFSGKEIKVGGMKLRKLKHAIKKPSKKAQKRELNRRLKEVELKVKNLKGKQPELKEELELAKSKIEKEMFSLAEEYIKSIEKRVGKSNKYEELLSRPISEIQEEVEKGDWDEERLLKLEIEDKDRKGLKKFLEKKLKKD